MPPKKRAGNDAGKKKKTPAPTKPSELDELSVFDLDSSPILDPRPGAGRAAINDDPVPLLSEDGCNRLRMEQVLQEIQITQRIGPTRLDEPSLDKLLSPKPLRKIHSAAVHEPGKWTFLFAPAPFTTEGRIIKGNTSLVSSIGSINFIPFRNPNQVRFHVMADLERHELTL